MPSSVAVSTDWKLLAGKALMEFTITPSWPYAHDRRLQNALVRALKNLGFQKLGRIEVTLRNAGIFWYNIDPIVVRILPQIPPPRPRPTFNGDPSLELPPDFTDEQDIIRQRLFDPSVKPSWMRDPNAPRDDHKDAYTYCSFDVGVDWSRSSSSSSEYISHETIREAMDRFQRGPRTRFLQRVPGRV